MDLSWKNFDALLTLLWIPRAINMSGNKITVKYIIRISKPVE